VVVSITRRNCRENLSGGHGDIIGGVGGSWEVLLPGMHGLLRGVRIAQPGVAVLLVVRLEPWLKGVHTGPYRYLVDFTSPAISSSTLTSCFTFNRKLLGSLIPQDTYGTSNFPVPFQCSPANSACTAATISWSEP
jgi:hypothetical protein